MSAPPEVPVLSEFAAGLSAVSWFAAVGDPPTAAEPETAASYLAGLGLSDVDLAWAADWAQAEALTNDAGWSDAWWQAEDRARQDLLGPAHDRLGERPLMAALDRIMRTASDAVMGPAAMAAARAGVADQALIRVAAGAATQACYQAGLALAAEAASDHPFRVKFRLFQSGRWPLGLIDGRFYVF